jgi:hypothetical protein
MRNERYFTASDSKIYANRTFARCNLARLPCAACGSGQRFTVRRRQLVHSVGAPVDSARIGAAARAPGGRIRPVPKSHQSIDR